ncbi:MAG: AraC family transcriptional regulator, partial [Epibacterium sp.]|nr:AraC family transcriptional regulator [Epibacterium sp.]NQX76088.1 helix-turn-helix transcriptional regulator [Epibacterium sp.]
MSFLSAFDYFEAKHVAEEVFPLCGGGGCQVFTLAVSPAVRLTMVRGCLEQDCRLSAPQEGGTTKVIYVLSGSTACGSNAVPDTWLNEGMGELTESRKQPTVRLLRAGEKVSVVCLNMPAGYLEHLFRHKCPLPLQDARSGSRSATAGRQFFLMPKLKSVLLQLTDCSLRKELQHLFLTAKSYELLSLTLDQLCTGAHQTSLSQADVACLEKARLLLDENLVSPPSLIDLAHEVGINDFKLKKGFKELYKMTRYAYLRERRMMAAQQALVETGMSVTEVANQVGYTNLGHFAAAFRKQFGAMPKDFK